MRDGGNIHAVEQSGADWMGFIFYPRSPRYMKYPPSYMPRIQKRVGVFVNSDIDEVTYKAHAYGLDYIQLHGDETPDYCAALRERWTAGRGTRGDLPLCHVPVSLLSPLSALSPVGIPRKDAARGRRRRPRTGRGGVPRRADAAICLHLPLVSPHEVVMPDVGKRRRTDGFSVDGGVVDQQLFMLLELWVGDGDGGDERAGIGVERMPEQLLCRGDLHDPPLVNHPDAVGNEADDRCYSSPNPRRVYTA